MCHSHICVSTNKYVLNFTCQLVLQWATKVVETVD